MRKKHGGGNAPSRPKSVAVVGKSSNRERLVANAQAGISVLAYLIPKLEEYNKELDKYQLTSLKDKEIQEIVSKYFSEEEYATARKYMLSNLDEKTDGELEQYAQFSWQTGDNIEKLLKELPTIDMIRSQFLLKGGRRRRKTNRRKR